MILLKKGYQHKFLAICGSSEARQPVGTHLQGDALINHVDIHYLIRCWLICLWGRGQHADHEGRGGVLVGHATSTTQG